MKIIIVIASIILATTLLVSSSLYLPNINLHLSENTFIDGLLKYQVLALTVALVVLILTIKLTPESLTLLRFGDLNSTALKETWLGINGKSTWRINGLLLTFFISLATGIFMFMAVKQTNSLANFSIKLAPIIIFLSLTNSLSEEIIFRFAVNGNLSSVASKTGVLIISAILFGLPHYFGNPSGVIGVLMSTALGYILSKATYETQGLGLAVLIHFFQDVIIFTGVLMINLPKVM